MEVGYRKEGMCVTSPPYFFLYLMSVPPLVEYTSDICSPRNVLIPQIRTVANESLHQRNTLRIIKDNNANTVIA